MQMPRLLLHQCCQPRDTGRLSARLPACLPVSPPPCLRECPLQFTGQFLGTAACWHQQLAPAAVQGSRPPVSVQWLPAVAERGSRPPASAQQLAPAAMERSSPPASVRGQPQPEPSSCPSSASPLGWRSWLPASPQALRVSSTRTHSCYHAVLSCPGRHCAARRCAGLHTPSASCSRPKSPLTMPGPL
jgi:hypothetical protein